MGIHKAVLEYAINPIVVEYELKKSETILKQNHENIFRIVLELTKMLSFMKVGFVIIS